jgi:gamma-glutamyltranspeptidase/glutathione hydrolase
MPYLSLKLQAATASLIISVSFNAQAQQAADAVAPEIASAYDAKSQGLVVKSENWMISAANPLAVQAGAKILAAGGSAADAMVATQVVLGLVEPQSSGLGGGAFLVWYDAASGKLITIDGRETAPMNVTPKLFQDENGEPLKFFDAVVGGLSVGTPGTPALMAKAHELWGKANWDGLFNDAITLADEGFVVSPRLATSVAGDAERLSRFKPTADYFLPGGTPIASGDTLKNPAYAETLLQIALDGVVSFYTGTTAEGIVETVQNTDGNPGVLEMQDLAVY